MEGQSSFEKAFSLNLDQNAITVLKETAKWTKFLSILGFIGIGFMVLFGLFFGSLMASAGAYSSMGALPSTFYTLFYIIAAAIGFFPILYLYKFSSKLKAALSSNNTSVLSEAFTNLKSHYKFNGIMAIVMISLWIISFIVGIFTAASAAASF